SAHAFRLRRRADSGSSRAGCATPSCHSSGSRTSINTALPEARRREASPGLMRSPAHARLTNATKQARRTIRTVVNFTGSSRWRTFSASRRFLKPGLRLRSTGQVVKRVTREQVGAEGADRLPIAAEVDPSGDPVLFGGAELLEVGDRDRIGRAALVPRGRVHGVVWFSAAEHVVETVLPVGVVDETNG